RAAGETVAVGGVSAGKHTIASVHQQVLQHHADRGIGVCDQYCIGVSAHGVLLGEQDGKRFLAPVYQKTAVCPYVRRITYFCKRFVMWYSGGGTALTVTHPWLSVVL